MQILKTHYHTEVKSLEGRSILERIATRSITVQDGQILLMYTKRYEDYSLPGGGVDEGEDRVEGMKRELCEETGAEGIKNIQPFGVYEEYRPWHKPEYDIVHMMSYCYTCDINKELGEANLESYEINNGMKAVWINIQDAIAHNKKTMATSEKKGMS
ncbi:NUDIX domain-containing protein, partial [Saprospiraceae bacterium]|nr:NUDIX domain-containing protein [Saprospiraceae bacterium]